MTGKQRATLRGMANGISAIFQVGKGGINDNLVKQINEALEARELVKLSVLENCDSSTKEVANEISGLTNSECVGVVGNKFVLYKKSKNNPKIEI